MQPIVSVIIPTHDRPALVVRAARSALAQTMGDLEVIVLVKPDDTGAAALREITDPRLRLITLERRLLPGPSRNAGVRHARADWVAFLDDDDEWVPEKLEIQLATARQSTNQQPIVSCRQIARRPGVDFIWPRRLPEPAEPVSEYLFCQRSLFWGEGMAPPSTVLARRELLVQVPFREDIPRQEDHHWLLEAEHVAGARLEFPATAAPLVIRHIDEDRPRIGNSRANWRHSFDWARGNRPLFTRRAYAGFLMRGLARAATKARRWDAFLPLLGEALRRGRPSGQDLVFYLAVWLTPQTIQRRLAARRARRT